MTKKYWGCRGRKRGAGGNPEGLVYTLRLVSTAEKNCICIPCWVYFKFHQLI